MVRKGCVFQVLVKGGGLFNVKNQKRRILSFFLLYRIVHVLGQIKFKFLAGLTMSIS